MKRCFLVLTLLLLTLALLPLAPTTEACVGKTLHVGTAGSDRQDLLAHALATLISERTGTTIKVVRYDSLLIAHETLLKAELDIAVEFTGHARTEILKQPAIADAAALYAAVKESYNQELNLIWLAPLGYSDAKLGQAATVVRKDTLKKFPALARLLDKLGNKFDEATMQRLEAQIKGGKSAQDVARTFLKEQKLI